MSSAAADEGSLRPDHASKYTSEQSSLLCNAILKLARESKYAAACMWGEHGNALGCHAITPGCLEERWPGAAWGDPPGQPGVASAAAG